MKSFGLIASTCCVAAIVAPAAPARADKDIFAHDNRVAWCIVPFDAKKRGPEERAAMLANLTPDYHWLREWQYV